uniref:Uncharacterized protein n=1 Tax=Eutreptiella gymnastica TaxID=73025 RepID=A0A7S1ILI1_9EUGL|mmetsp:Transcript_25364/g.45840  ORF Transcript_25364/g.45840 Transcript_25364/m.45840 type:complete len:126 (+) Transcript_25364:338-715(+)
MGTIVEWMEKGDFFVLGGKNHDGTTTTDVWCYVAKESYWYQMLSMQKPKCEPMAVRVVVGHDEEEVHVIDRYCPGTYEVLHRTKWSGSVPYMKYRLKNVSKWAKNLTSDFLQTSNVVYIYIVVHK